jgi:uncharacterized protein YabN with tetrapyrrole methylase and pyrophosphatase domain
MYLNTTSHIYRLRFSVDKTVPLDSINRWLDFKNECESGNNRHIVENMKESCLLKINKDLPYLNRAEGGLGGSDNIRNKQIRFRNGSSTLQKHQDNDIIMDNIYNGENEMWRHEEIDDLLSAFIKVARYYLDFDDCLRGCVEMIPKNSFRY